MDQTGLIPPDAEAAFDAVIARIEALRSETVGRIATLGTSLGFEAAAATIAPPAPVPTAAAPRTGRAPLPRLARRRPVRVARRSAVAVTLAATAADVRSGLRSTASDVRSGLRSAASDVRSGLRSAASAASRALPTVASHGSRWARAGTTRLRSAALARALRSSLAAARSVADRIPARAVPVSLVVLVVAAGGSLALRAADTGRDGGASPIPDLATPVAPILPPASPAPAPASPASPAPAPAPRPSPEPAPLPEPGPTVAARRPPSLVRIPAIGVDALTVPVGLEADGSMEIPKDVSTIGWYEPGEGVGVAPGQVGTAVLAGHVDSRTQGAGAFYHLRDLSVGDLIEVEHADGTLTRWRVTSVTQYAKDRLPIDEVFVWDGPPRLALITCGGIFDWTIRSYTDNIVVTAVLLEDAPAPDDLAVAGSAGAT